MDHAEARELLELAATEPDGFDRLAAGDTGDAAALAGHLAGCEPCAMELERLRLLSLTLREILAGERGLPDDEPRAVPAGLRERTLGYVRDVGRDRSVDASAAGSGAPRRPDVRALGRLVALAAAVIIAAGLGGFVVSRQYQATVDRQDATVAALTRVTTWGVRLGAAPDARTVALVDPSGSDAAGTLVFSPSSGDLVVIMNGAAEPPAGREFRCWVEIAGIRQRVGQMHFGGELGYWVGRVEGLSTVPAGTLFGVSLVDASGGQIGDPLLLGTL